MRDKNGYSAYTNYFTFYIGGSTTNYRLHIFGYSGTAGDSLGYHNLMKFSTKDNDKYSGNCAIYHIGVWWYNRCDFSNLNGHYNTHIGWGTFSQQPLLFSEMKLRRINN